MSAAGGAGSSGPIAASQTTVFVTVGNSGVVFGHSASAGVGSSAPSGVLGRTVNSIFRDGISLQVFLAHGGNPLSQSAFHTLLVRDATGSRVFSTSSLGSTGFFLPSVGGTLSNWTWKGTGIDTLPWNENDIGSARAVLFLR